MQYFSPHDLSEVLGIQSPEALEQHIQSILDYLPAHASPTVNIYGEDFKVYEIEGFLNSIGAQERIFIEWIRLHPGLKKALTIKKFSALRVDNVVRDHTFFPKFKAFISPFLRSGLDIEMKEACEHQDWNRISDLLSYTLLLKEDDVLKIERPVCDLVEAQMKLIGDKSAAADTERALMNAVELLSKPNFYSSLNQLSKANYHIRLLPIEMYQELLSHKLMNKQVARVILAQIQHLQLNSSQAKKVDDFSKAIRSGKLVLKQEKSKKRRSKYLQWQRVLALLLLGTIVSVGFGFYFTNVEVPVAQINYQQSGFDSISSDQMRQLDSMYKPVLEEEIDIEEVAQDVLSGMSIVLVDDTSQFIENRQMKNLQHDLFLDFRIQNYLIQSDPYLDDCNPIKHKEGFKINHIPLDFDTLNGKPHSFINSTNCDVYIMVFENTYNGRVKAVLVPRGERMEIGLNEKDCVLFYAGQNMSPFRPSQTANHGYGSTQYRSLMKGVLNYHFCDFDGKGKYLLQQLYHVEDEVSGSTELKKTGTNGFKLLSDCLVRVN